jgi:hypothetical protein
LERDGGVGVLVRDHGEDQHRKRENEIADLVFQGCVLSVGVAEG